MKKAMYPGTFDPLTNGHYDIIERASLIVDELHILVAENIHKKTVFTIDERVAMIKKVVGKFKNVKVIPTSDLVARYAMKNNIEINIRGLRNFKDYEYEYQLSQYNRDLYPKLETILLFSLRDQGYISSSSIKEFVYFDVDISNYVPKEIKDEIVEKLKKTIQLTLIKKPNS